MNNINSIKDLWQNAASPSPLSIEELMKEISKKRNKMMHRNIFGILSLLAAASVVTWVGISYDAKYQSTRIGIILVLLAIVGGIFINSQLLQLMLKPMNLAMDSKSYTQAMKNYQSKQAYLHGQGMVIYFCTLGIGLALYLWEFTHANIPFLVAVYGISFGWIGLVWFFIRPRTIRKEKERMSEIIGQLERISKQIEE